MMSFRQKLLANCLTKANSVSYSDYGEGHYNATSRMEMRLVSWKKEKEIMALVNDGWELTLNLVDKQNDSVSKVYELDAADYAGANAAIINVLTFFGGVSDLVVTGYILREVTVENALVLPAVGNASDKALVSARKTNTKRTPIEIPAPKDAIFVSAAGAGNNILDDTNIALQAYLELFVAAGDCFLSDGEKLAGAPVQIVDGRRRQ